MQNRDSIGKCRIWLWRIALFLLMLIALPVAFPFALVFSGPFVAIEAFYKHVEYNDSRVQKFFAVTLGFIAGIVFDPFIWIGIIIVFAPKICNGIKEYFRARRRRREITDDRLNERLIKDAIGNADNLVYENERE